VKDVRSGFVIGIIALPMSLGIAMASGFPPFAGLVSSLVGGLLVSFISGSRLCIKGPAGGLSALTLSSVLVLGNGDLGAGYSLTLAAIIVGGVLQVLSAYARMGNLGDFFPAAAIHGMLAGLGFIMAMKQIPPTLGISEGNTDIFSLFKQFPELVTMANPKVALLGVICLGILFVHRFLPQNIVKAVPSVILMLAIAVPLGMLLGLEKEHDYSFFGKSYSILPENQLVNFPSDVLSTLQFPNFYKINTLNFWVFAFIFSLAGNIESLLTCKAVDQIDPWRRQSNFNQDLFAIGVGNIVCGFCGGLPIISESKRSVVNINLGGSTFASNFFHAFFLLLLILFAQPFIRLIPIAALSAFLISTGIKMALPREFSKSYRIGKEQFAVFLVVFMFTISTNLLFGVVAGTLLELIINMRFGGSSSSLFQSNLTLERKSPYHYEAMVNGPATFSNFLWVKKELESVPSEVDLVIDFSKASVVDHSFMENLSYFQTNRENQGGNLSITGLDYHEQISTHPLASRRIVRNETTPRQQELGLFAETQHIDFDSRRMALPTKFNQFRLSNNLIVLHQENVLRTAKDKSVVEISDIQITWSLPAKQTFDVTVLTIPKLPFEVPDFFLQTEGFEKKLWSTENSADINFPEFPVFSYYYYLSGEDEEEIRKFFSPPLIQFFEQHKGYNLCISEGAFLVYKRPDLLSVEEIENLYTYMEQFLLSSYLGTYSAPK
jgi:MFS superfamily sulfate permease-like transporter